MRSNDRTKTTTAALAAGHAALIAANVATGAPPVAMAVLVVLWLPVAAWAAIVWTPRRASSAIDDCAPRE